MQEGVREVRDILAGPRSVIDQSEHDPAIHIVTAPATARSGSEAMMGMTKSPPAKQMRPMSGPKQDHHRVSLTATSGTRAIGYVPDQVVKDSLLGPNSITV